MFLQPAALLIALFALPAEAFVGFEVSSQHRAEKSSACCAAGQGFGKAPKRTYGKDVMPSRDVIDVETAMKEFFAAREEWIPLFRTMATDASCMAIDFLEHIDEEVEFHETSAPWRRLEAIPQEEGDRTILASFLDESQKSLIDIPVNEATNEDDNDVQFIEEGRRLLTLNRFHVLRDNCGKTVESIDALFSACWSELLHLSSVGEMHSGSLIILPQYELRDLRRFTDMNVVQPLEWLGIHSDFEVASLQQGSSAIRLIYKLSDIPEPQPSEEDSQ